MQIHLVLCRAIRSTNRAPMLALLVEAYEKKIAAGLSSLFSKFKRALRKPASLLVSSHKLFLHRQPRGLWFLTNQFENLRPPFDESIHCFESNLQ